MEDGSYTLTEEDNDYFLNEISKWKHFLGLHRYHIDVQEMEYNSDTAGTCSVDESQKHVTIEIAQEWDYKPTNKALSKIAFHECLELMLNNLRSGSVFNWDITNGWVHEIIGVLETTLFEMEWNKAK